MKICFVNRKLEKIFNSHSELVKSYGSEQASKIKMRLKVLEAAANLAEVPTQKPDRCHPLKGDKKGQFAVDLKNPFRLIFIPSENISPAVNEGIDTSKVTTIIIIGVEDYHGD